MIASGRNKENSPTSKKTAFSFENADNQPLNPLPYQSGNNSVSASVANLPLVKQQTGQVSTFQSPPKISFLSNATDLDEELDPSFFEVPLNKPKPKSLFLKRNNNNSYDATSNSDYAKLRKAQQPFPSHNVQSDGSYSDESSSIILGGWNDDDTLKNALKPLSIHISDIPIPCEITIIKEDHSITPTNNNNVLSDEKEQKSANTNDEAAVLRQEIDILRQGILKYMQQNIELKKIINEKDKIIDEQKETIEKLLKQ